MLAEESFLSKHFLSCFLFNLERKQFGGSEEKTLDPYHFFPPLLPTKTSTKNIISLLLFFLFLLIYFPIPLPTKQILRNSFKRTLKQCKQFTQKYYNYLQIKFSFPEIYHLLRQWRLQEFCPGYSYFTLKKFRVFQDILVNTGQNSRFGRHEVCA